MGEIHPHNLTEASFPPNVITELKHSGELWGDAVHSISWGLILAVLVTYKPEVIIAATALSSCCIPLWGPNAGVLEESCPHRNTSVWIYIYKPVSSREFTRTLEL